MIRTRLVLLSVFLLVLLNSLCRASDQVAEVRLYAIDCGRMDFKDMGALFSDTGEYACQAGTFVDPCFLIRHPKGTLLWDTGLGDKISENKNGIEIPEFGVHMAVSAGLVDQLTTMNMSASDITYLAFSHFHFDHTGNAGLFAGSTWIVQKAVLANAEQMPQHADLVAQSQVLEFEGNARAEERT